MQTSGADLLWTLCGGDPMSRPRGLELAEEDESHQRKGHHPDVTRDRLRGEHQLDVPWLQVTRHSALRDEERLELNGGLQRERIGN